MTSEPLTLTGSLAGIARPGTLQPSKLFDAQAKLHYFSPLFMCCSHWEQKLGHSQTTAWGNHRIRLGRSDWRRLQGSSGPTSPGQTLKSTIKRGLKPEEMYRGVKRGQAVFPAVSQQREHFLVFKGTGIAGLGVLVGFFFLKSRPRSGWVL